MLVAKIYWQEQVSVRLFTVKGECTTYPFHAACQEKAVLADRLLQGKGESFAFQWLAYTGCVLLYLSSCGITVRDCGGLNLAVSGNTALEALPRLLFIDCLSWTGCNSFLQLDRLLRSCQDVSADPGSWQRLLEGGRRQNNASTRLPRSAQHTLST